MAGYMKHLSRLMNFSEGLLVYSLWEGYRRRPGMQKFLRECEETGLAIVAAHVSGHVDSKAIEALLQLANPAVIKPIQTENAAWFKNKLVGVQVCERDFLKPNKAPNKTTRAGG